MRAWRIRDSFAQSCDHEIMSLTCAFCASKYRKRAWRSADTRLTVRDASVLADHLLLDLDCFFLPHHAQCMPSLGPPNGTIYLSFSRVSLVLQLGEEGREGIVLVLVVITVSDDRGRGAPRGSSKRRSLSTLRSRSLSCASRSVSREEVGAGQSPSRELC